MMSLRRATVGLAVAMHAITPPPGGPRRPECVCDDCWALRSRSVAMPSALGAFGPSGAIPAYIYCQPPTGPAPRPAHFELQFKLLGPDLAASTCLGTGPIRCCAAEPVDPDWRSLTRPIEARSSMTRCSGPTATAYGRPQCGCPGGPGLCKGRFGADRLAGGRPELRHTAVQSTFIPMRNPDRFTMAAASTAQGGV
jgi:hypothetical protein